MTSPSESFMRSPACVVCGGDSRPCISLTAQPIYQHPIAADIAVPEPHSLDLTWVACAECGHAWQPSFDGMLLERIYRSHYYTPTPDGIAVQFREDFLACVRRFGLVTPREVLLEVGASNGDVLAELRRSTGAAKAYAFEPNAENAAIARTRGLDVFEAFFDARVEQHDIRSANFIYSRHVIEHVFALADFFSGVDAVATPDADLVLETPSLDFHAERGSIAPFHVEHVHVFSLRSLSRLAMMHGWVLDKHEVTSDGNLIASFKRKDIPVRSTEPAYPHLVALQGAVAAQRERLHSVLADHPLVFWGAGSASVKLARLIGREPDYWTDGNPNKIGKRFVGLSRTILDPAQALTMARSDAGEAILVIASSFTREILPRVRELGWKGKVVDMTGSVL